MSTSEKNKLKKNQCIHLATIVASLALGHVSDIHGNNEEFSPMTSFLSAESCDYSVDCEIINEFASPSGRGSSN